MLVGGGMATTYRQQYFRKGGIKMELVNVELTEKELMELEGYNKRNLIRDGKYLNVFINDASWKVRKAVARQGYGLDILINDANWKVRKAVARQGYGLDKLINDEEWAIRIEVARQGYGLDKLINDKNWEVRDMAIEKLLEFYKNNK